MPTTWLASDTHLGHRLMERIRPWDTLEEHDEAIIENWNKVVKPNDVVWHLGDVCMNRSKLHLAGRLNGRKKLVMGNHDTHPMSEYLEYFEEVRGIKVFQWAVLTHVPVHVDQLRRFTFNIHGHLHGHQVMRWNGNIPQYEPDPCYFNVAMENINYIPISVDEIKEKLGV